MTDYEAVTKYFIENNKTITFMESCTSGLLASIFTDTEGASAVFKGSLVTYSNEAKIAAGVNAKIIENYGVYSAECARAMAETAQKIYATDVAVGITGTTGNIDPCNDDSVQGEVFYCIIFDEEILEYHFKCEVNNLSRQAIKELYAKEVYSNLKKIASKS